MPARPLTVRDFHGPRGPNVRFVEKDISTEDYEDDTQIWYVYPVNAGDLTCRPAGNSDDDGDMTLTLEAGAYWAPGGERAPVKAVRMNATVDTIRVCYPNSNES